MSRLRLWYGAVLFLAVLGVLMVVGGTDRAAAIGVCENPNCPQSIGILDGAARGVQASIETANPALRDCGSYPWCFSFVRTTVQDTSGGGNKFGEVGWIKGGTCGVTGPKKVITYKGSGIWSRICLGSLVVGSTHSYRIDRADPPWQTIWDFYIDGVVQDARPLDTSDATRVFCGGEVSTSANAMGVSGCLWNAVRPSWASYGSFYYYNHSSVDVSPPYQLVDLASPPYSWQVYGNN